MTTIARFATIVAALFYLAMPFMAVPFVSSGAHGGAGLHSPKPMASGIHHAMAATVETNAHGCRPQAEAAGFPHHCGNCVVPLPEVAMPPEMAILRDAPPPAEALTPAPHFAAPLDPPPRA